MSDNNETTVRPSKGDFPVKWLFLRDLDVHWIASQRPIKQRQVNKIAKNLDPGKIGVLCVCKVEGENFYHIIDGQHRAEAVRQLWGDSQRVQCEVIEGVRGPEEAAELWLGRNTTSTKATSYEQFMISVQAGRETEVAVNTVIEACGYKVGPNKLMAVKAAMTVYNSIDAEGLAWVLFTLQDIFGDDDYDAVQAALLRGFGLFYDRHYNNPNFDRDRLIKKVSKKYTPNRLYGSARNVRDSLVKPNLAEAVVEILVNTHNLGLRKNNHI